MHIGGVYRECCECFTCLFFYELFSYIKSCFLFYLTVRWSQFRQKHKGFRCKIYGERVQKENWKENYFYLFLETHNSMLFVNNVALFMAFPCKISGKRRCVGNFLLVTSLVALFCDFRLFVKMKWKFNDLQSVRFLLMSFLEAYFR